MRRRRPPPEPDSTCSCPAASMLGAHLDALDLDAHHHATVLGLELCTDPDTFTDRWASACAGARTLWIERAMSDPGWHNGLAGRVDLVAGDLTEDQASHLRPAGRTVVAMPLTVGPA